jgi:putative transposase
VLLQRQRFSCSASTVGRTISCLKARGILNEPPKNHVSAPRRRIKRPYAIRKPKDYLISEPGDLVQLDTLDIRPLPGVVLKQFTARDVILRWDVLEVHRQAAFVTAAHFLHALEERMPFLVKAIQVDGGSEFEAAFEEECQKRNIRLFVLPPNSPKLNGYVGRVHLTHTKEFYGAKDSSFNSSSPISGLPHPSGVP